MPDFPVNTHRRNPYPGHNFLVKWDGRVVAGVSRITGLGRRTEVVRHRSGGDPGRDMVSPGRTRFDPVTMERGVTHDTQFEEWANLVHRADGSAGSRVALRDFRKDVVLELLNEAGQVALAYHLFGCWPSTWVAVPELDANGQAQVAIQTLELQVESWIRDVSVTEPVEPGAPKTRRDESDSA